MGYYKCDDPALAYWYDFTTSAIIIVLLLLFISPWRNFAFQNKEQRTAVKAVYDG